MAEQGQEQAKQPREQVTDKGQISHYTATPWELKAAARLLHQYVWATAHQQGQRQVQAALREPVGRVGRYCELHGQTFHTTDFCKTLKKRAEKNAKKAGEEPDPGYNKVTKETVKLLNE